MPSFVPGQDPCNRQTSACGSTGLRLFTFNLGVGWRRCARKPLWVGRQFCRVCLWATQTAPFFPRRAVTHRVPARGWQPGAWKSSGQGIVPAEVQVEKRGWSSGEHAGDFFSAWAGRVRQVHRIRLALIGFYKSYQNIKLVAFGGILLGVHQDINLSQGVSVVNFVTDRFYRGVTSYGLRVNSVILRMCADKTNVYNPVRVIYPHH